jgi:holo-[acyl-carrier-protein] synthase
MKILGIGTDIVNNSRIENLLKKKNMNFLNKVFSNNEINLSKKRKNSILTLSKRFAAKEAFIKALGTGLRKGINFKDIEIVNDNQGKPSINLKGQTKDIVKKIVKKKNFKIFLSVSDDYPWSVANVIITY